MNSEILQIHQDAASEVLDGLMELSASYLAELPAMSQMLRYDFICGKMNKNADLVETAAGRAHQIRGTAGALGFVAVGKIAGILDQRMTLASEMMRSGELPAFDEIGAAFDDFDLAIRQCRDEPHLP